MAIRSVRARWMHRMLCPFLALASPPRLPCVRWHRPMPPRWLSDNGFRDSTARPSGPRGRSRRRSAKLPVPGQPVPGQPNAGMIDTRFVSPNAAIVVVLRPAQIMAAPIAQIFPVEVATAAGLQYMGFDPAQIDEVVAFAEMSNPTAPGYCVTFKFKNPIRASSIPVEARAHAQLAEFNGKKYLKSSIPMQYSLYGPNNHTLVMAAPMPRSNNWCHSASKPKSGPLMDRIQRHPGGKRSVPGGRFSRHCGR